MRHVSTLKEAFVYLTEALVYQAQYEDRCQNLEGRTHALMAAEKGIDWIMQAKIEVPVESVINEVLAYSTIHDWIAENKLD